MPGGWSTPSGAGPGGLFCRASHGEVWFKAALSNLVFHTSPVVTTRPARGKEALPVISLQIVVLAASRQAVQMARCRETGSGRLCPRLLLLLLLGAALGSQLHPPGTATPGANESLAELWDGTVMEPEEMYRSQLHNMTEDEKYHLIAYICWANFSLWMMNLSSVQLCEWRVISRPYSDLRHCLETFAEKQNYRYPNSIAEEYIMQSHHLYFLNCTREHPVFLDPPEDVLLALILAPICLIPFLVTLVVWRSKDGKMQA